MGIEIKALNYIIVLLWILCNESTYMTYTLVNTEKAAQKHEGKAQG